jgi:ADP-heptose:LPS heptosyltransferase
MKFAIIRSSSIGDVILSTGALSWAQQHDKQLIWIGSEPTISILKESYPKNDYFKLEGLSARKLKSMGVTKCVDLQGSFRSRWFCLKLLLLGISSSSYDKRRFFRSWLVMKSRLLGRRRLLTLNQRVEPQHRLMTESCLESMGVVTNATSNTTVPTPSITISHLTAKVPSSVTRELDAGRWICVAPGASYETKKAPLEVWVSLIDNMRSLANQRKDFSSLLTVGIVTIGTETEREICSQFLDRIEWAGPKLNLAGRLNLVQTTSVIGMTDIMLCNDSGPLHLAEAQNVSVFAMFGPTVREFGFFPWKKTSKVFESRLGCRPCSKHGATPCRYGDQLCFETIDIPKMANEVLSFLATESSRGNT